MRSSRMRIVGAVAAVLAVTACGSQAGSAPGALAGSESAVAPLRVATDCPTAPELPPPGEQPLPDGFSAVSVLRCDDELRAVPGQGTWFFRVEQRADVDAAALLAALRRPDEPVPADTACAAIAIAVPYFVLIDADGTAVRPRAPKDVCGQPQRQVLDALKRLPFAETAATRRNQEQSQQSIDTGCGQMWVDALAGDTLAHTRPAADRRIWAKTPDSVKICLWRNVPGAMPQLESAGTVSGPQLTSLLARLDHLPAAASCAPRHQRFVVIQYQRHGWYDDAVYAELDGCGLLLRPDHTLAHVDAATAALLTRLAR